VPDLEIYQRATFYDPFSKNLPEAGAAARIAAHNWRQTALLHPDNALLSKWLHRNLKFLFFFKI
jgi:hypothetical protein